MTVAIFIVLCAILGVLILMLPKDAREEISDAVSTVWAILVLSLVLGGVALVGFFVYVCITNPRPVFAFFDRIPTWAWLLFLAILFVCVFWAESRENRKIKTGDPDAIERRIQALMDRDGVLKYTRAQAEEAVRELRNEGNKE